MEIFKYEDHVIEYTLEKKKIKNLYILVKDGKLKVKVPLKTSQEKINSLLKKRIFWIEKNIKVQKEKTKPVTEFKDGVNLKILGENKVLKVVYNNNQTINFDINENNIICNMPEKYKNNDFAVQKSVEKFYEKLSQSEIDYAMQKVINNVGLKPNKYKLKKLKSTWGNCSSTKNISLNKNLVFYSRQAIEYVCLHEVCHLKYMNHSKDFWSMVESYMPDYKMAQKELNN